MRSLLALLLTAGMAFAQAPAEKPKDEAKKMECCCCSMDKDNTDAKKEGCCAAMHKDGKEGSMCARNPMKDGEKHEDHK